MRLTALPIISGILAAACATQTYAASSFARAYAFDFRNGNLVRNWSFESLADNWFDDAGSTARYLAKKDGIAAVSGSFVAKHSSTNSTGSTYRRLTGEFIPVEAGITYTFSAYVKTSGNTAGVHPYLAYYLDRSANANGTTAGPNYPVNSNWTLVSFQFTPPAGTANVQVSLIEIPANEGGTFYFDDVVIETGVSSPSNRDSIQESVSFLNDAGEGLQTQQKIAGGGYNPSRTYLVKSDSLDYALRQVRDYLPFLRTGSPDFDAAFTNDAAVYNNGSNGMGTLGGYPFSSTEYSEALARPIASTSMPGTAWNPSDGSRKMKSGSYFTNSLVAPADPEAEFVNDADLPYLYSWEKDVEGKHTLTWKNALGQVVQTAIMPNTTWLYTRYEYFANGKLKKVLQDSDVPGDDAHQDFRQVTNYNSASEVTSTYTQDRGLRKYWYNRLGQLRFTRHESQATDEYDYTSYDDRDRPYSMGVQVIPGMGTANVEQRDTPSGKTEQKGLIYDNLSTFQSRTGLLLSDILPLINVGLNGDGRVVCEYNLNKSVNLSSFSAKDRFVATFYNYNSYGEITDEYKYIGPVRNPDKRIHRVIFFYDNNHRLYQTMLQDNGATPLVTIQHYDFDPLGRIVKVTGASGKFYASYSYYDWGGLKSVVMGGTGSSNSGTRMDFNYHAQGWVKEIRATRQSTGEVEFQQILGYDNPVAISSTIPGVVPKYDGSIAQQLVKFAQDLDASNPIRVTNYQYDNMDRMLTADTRKSTGTPPWDANKQIIFGSLQLTDTDDQDTRLTFDSNGRIATNQSGVAAADQATYAYQGNSYKLDHVGGKLNPDTQRDASPAGTFTYDARGRLTGDASKKLTMTYGWDDMPLQFDVDTGDSLYSDREFYDAQGTRVCRVRIKTQAKVWVPIFDGQITILVKGYLSPDALIPKVVQSITDVNLLNSGDRRWVETYDDAGTIASSSGKSGVFGVSGQIGELNSDGTYRYFVKNHLGSIMRTVGDDGEYMDGSGNATDYLAYGTQKKLKLGSTEQVQSFTGKEQEDATGEYSFGARWYDPELALFLSLDPAGQYTNGYSYGGGNAINGTDPSGMWWNPFDGDDWKDLGTSIRDWDRNSPYGGWADFGGFVGGAIYNAPGDFHSWAGGYGRGDEDNILRQMYRAMTGGPGAPNCGSDRGDGGCWDEPNQGGIGIKIGISDGGHGSYTATDADGRDLFPIYWSNYNHNVEHSRIYESKPTAFKRSTPEDVLGKSGTLLDAYYDIVGDAQYFWETYVNEKFHAALDKNGNKEEFGMLFNANGKLKVGVLPGWHENGRGTMGHQYDGYLYPGDVFVHSHPYRKDKLDMTPGGLSGDGDMQWASDHGVGIYAYETTTGEVYYSNPKLMEWFGISEYRLSNMYVGKY